MFKVLEDTIAAISSAIGYSPRGIIRLCGPEAIPIADVLFRPNEMPPLGERGGHAHCLGRLRLSPPNASPVVPAEAYLFRGPRSYTRQDIVELHTLGSPPILSVVLQHCFARGARLAEAGEFSARAFFSGQLDMSEVEGVAALIHAESDAQLRAGERLLHGALSGRAAGLQDRLSDLLALIEADIDFTDEAIHFITPSQLRERLNALANDIRGLLSSSLLAERIETLPRIMLLGPPNVGKSSLLNRLTGLDRAICSPLPGTTRDVLTAPLEMPSGEAVLVDAAGMGRTETLIDRLADAAVHHAVSEAQMILFVVDISENPVRPCYELLEGLPERRMMILANKADLVAAEELNKRVAGLKRRGSDVVVAVSARTGMGLEGLIVGIEEILFAGATDSGGESIALNTRHRNAFGNALAAIERASGLAEGLTETLEAAEIIAVELHEANEHLGQIAGQVVTDDLLGRIFANFCIGK